MGEPWTGGYSHGPKTGICRPAAPIYYPVFAQFKTIFPDKKPSERGFMRGRRQEKRRGKGGNRQLSVAKNVILRRNQPNFETIDNEPYYLLKIGNLPFLW